MNHDDLIGFLDARAERVAKLSSRFDPDRPVSFFPTKWWPGFSGYSPVTGSAPSTRWQPINPAAVWANIMNTPYCEGPVKIVDRKSMPPFQNLNTDWDGVLACLNNVGRPSGEGEFRRPSGEFVVDLVKDPDGWKLLEAAHSVAHARALVTGGPPMFLETLAEMVLARRWNVSFWCPTTRQIVWLDKPEETGFMSHGPFVSVSVNMRKPWMFVPAVGQGAPVPGRHSIAILAGVHLEPEPWSARDDNPDKDDESWLEMNRWSCMPTIVCISGWKGLDELYKAPLVGKYRGSGKEDVCLTMPVTALDPPSALDALIGRWSDVGLDGTCPALGQWKVQSLLESDFLKGLKTVVPPLPCRDCLRLNMASPGAPSRPMSRRPDGKGPGDPEAEKEWAEYDAKVDKIFKVVDKACAFWDARFGDGRKNRVLRRRRSREASELAEKAARCHARAEKLLKDGELTRRSAELKAESQYRARIAEMASGL